jgi:hypothetical protein
MNPLLLLRALAVLLLARVGGRFVAGVIQGQRGEGADPGRPAAREGELVRDRVCNTFLPRESALRATVEGREEHFCSPLCRDRALAGVLRAP